MQTSDIGTSHSVSKFQKKCNFVKARTRSILQRLIKSTFNYFFLFLKFLINRPPSSIFLKNYVDISLFEVILMRARTLFIFHYFFSIFFPTVCKEGEENRQNVAQAYDYSQNSIAKNKPCKKALKKVGYTYYNNSINHVGGV